jgi:hypothetical protein
MYRTAPSSLDFGARSSYDAGTSSASAAHDDDVPDLGPNLNTTADVLSQIEDAPDPTSLHTLCRVDEHGILHTVSL